jgi:WD40 repeat protein
MINFIFLFLTFLNIHVQGMVDATIVPLAGKGIFSPSGKLLVVCGQKELSIYDTCSGKKLGDLENSASAHPNQQDSLIFSPQETYIALKSKIWKTADCQQHVPAILETEQVKAWNKSETKLFTAIPDKKLWFLIDSATGLSLHTFDYSHEFAPLQFSTSDDGTLFHLRFP